MANLEDFARIGYVLDHFTDARLIPAKSLDRETAKVAYAWMNSDNTPTPLVQFSMPVNGTYYVVEAVPSSKARVMAVISAYMSSGTKKGQSPQSSAETAGEPTASVTSKTPLELLGTAKNSIAHSSPTVNPNGVESYGETERLLLQTAQEMLTDSADTSARDAALRMLMGEKHDETGQDQDGEFYLDGNEEVYNANKSSIIDDRSKSPEPTSRYYVNHSELLYKNLQNVAPIDGYEDFAIHGVQGKPLVEIELTSGKTAQFTAAEFADILESDPEYHGGSIRLLSCGTGSEQSRFAQELADAIGQDVLAPTETLWIADNGEIFISDKESLAQLWYNDGHIIHSIKQTGKMKLFHPRKSGDAK